MKTKQKIHRGSSRRHRSMIRTMTPIFNFKILYMRSSYISMIMAVALSVSCSEQSTGNVPVMTLDHTVKDTANTLISEDLNFNIPISAQEIYICEDSIAVVCNKNSTWFLELYNLNENRLIKHLLRHGNGPGEMLDVNFYFNNDTIGIEDFQKDRIAIIPIHDAVYNDSYNPELRTLSLQSQYKLPFKGRLIALNPYCFINKEYGIDNNGPRFIITDSNYVYEDSSSYEYDTFNVSYSTFFISHINDRIVFVNTYKPELEIYDLRLNPLREILGPEMPSQKYLIEDDGDVVFLNTIPAAYSSFCHDESYFYVSYNGALLSYKNNFDRSLLKTWIMKFDWDGNFIDSYYIDYYIESMSLSKDSRYIYVFGTDSTGENVFYKYQLG